MNSAIHKIISVSLKQLGFLCLLTGLGIFCLPAYAQSEIQTDTSTLKTDSTLKYLTPWEYAFMMNEETSWLFKIDIPSTFHFNQIKLGIEKKIAPSFSLNLDLGYHQSIGFRNGNFSGFLDANGFYVSLETRWYYRMNKRVREEKVARNMSDNYLAIGLTYDQTLHTFSDFSYNVLRIYAKWGFQRRFLKHGHVDFGVKAGASLLTSRGMSPVFSFNNFIDVGLAFTKDKYTLDRNILCPVLKCYGAENYIFKSNLNGLLGIGLSKYSSYFLIAPHIAFEHKVGKSAFSINTEFRPEFSYSFIFYTSEQYKSWRTEMSLTLEGRWYYNLKRRILKGKSGNGLSANYMAFGSNVKYQHMKSNDNPYLNSYSPNIYVVTGSQRLFGKHLYYDLNVGIGYQFKTKYEEAAVVFPLKIAVGYRF